MNMGDIKPFIHNIKMNMVVWYFEKLFVLSKLIASNSMLLQIRVACS